MGIISRIGQGRTKEKAARQDKRSAITAAVKCAIEPLEARLLLSTTNAWKSAQSGDFDNPAMWSLGHVPTSSEDAVINVAGNFAITHNTGVADSVHSFVSNQGFTLSAGTLAAATTVEVDNTFNLAGGTLQGGTVLSGSGGQGITGSSGTLDGVTLSGGLALAGTTLNVKDGLTLSNGAVVALNNSADLYFLGTQTLGGSGAVAFGGTNQSFLEVHSIDSTPADAATLTIGSGVTIHSAGASGSVSANYYGDEKLINQGTITSDVTGKTIFLGTITNSGATVSATNGGTLNLGGSIIGGTVSVLSGGQVTGGGTLDGVTLSGGLTLAGTTLNVKDGLTLSNGAVVALNNSADLYFLGTQTLGGSGAVAFGGTNQSFLEVHSIDSTPADAATLTIGSGVTIHSAGASGSVSANYYGDEKLINQGTIAADVAGKTISVNGGGSGSNSGMLKAINGGILSVSGGLTGQGSTTIDATSTLTINGTIGGTITGASGAQVAGGGTLDGVTLSGGLALAGTTLNVKDGLTLSNGAVVALNNSADLYFLGTQTLGGSGAVAFGGTNQSFLEVHSIDSTPADAATLTIGSGVTIHSAGASGSVSANYYGDEKLINQGTITSDVTGKTIFLGTITNSGATVSATNGGTLNLGGSIIGGTVSVLSGGQVTGGGTLDGVTLSGGLTLAGTTLNVKDGLTLSNGAVVALNNSADLYFLGTQTLGGSGAVAFGGTNQSFLEVHSIDSTPADAATLTIGSGVTIHSAGASGSVSANYYGDEKLINQGTIAADVAGKTITIGSGSTVQNPGTLTATSGSISVSGPGLSNAGIISVGFVGSLNISGILTESATSNLNVVLGGSTAGLYGQIIVSGTTALGGTLNVSEANGYLPTTGTNFGIVTYSSATGQFTNYSGLTPSALVSLQPTYNPRISRFPL